MILRSGLRISAFMIALLVVALALPLEAWACPACALREDGGIAAKVILAAMMVLPFGLAGLVVYVLRKAAAEEKTHIPVTDLDPAGGEQRA